MKMKKDLPSFKIICGLIALPIVLILSQTIVQEMATSGIASGLTDAERKVEVARYSTN